MTTYDHLHVPLPEMPSWNKLTAPAKREFRNGVAARKRGSPIINNPWARSLGGRSYYKFEHFWNLGWKACNAMIEETT